MAAPPASPRGKRRRRRPAAGHASTKPSSSKTVSARPPTATKPKRRRRPRSRWGRRLAVAAACLAVLSLAALGVVRWSVERFSEEVGPTEEGFVEIVWPEGLSAADAARLLADAGLTESRARMTLFLRATGGTADFVPGLHLLPHGASPRELRALLTRAPDRPRAKVVIPEGFHRFAIAKRLEKLRVTSERAFLDASADPMLLDTLELPEGETSPESAEGFLFPATYDLSVDSPASEIVTTLVRESARRWQRLADRFADQQAALASELGWTRREIVILASIVEKEAAVDDERAVVASVFLNRLRSPEFQPKRLQSDPTAAYGCLARPLDAPSCAEYSGRVTPAMNRDALNRYSTYTHDGLPPGPICNPGERSLEAVLNPSQTSYLYFVATGGGRHTFSETYDDHKRAIEGATEKQ